VLKLRERPLRTGRGDLDRVIAQQVTQMPRDAGAEVEIDAVRTVEEHPQGRRSPAADHFDGQDLDIGLERAHALFDLRLNTGQIVSPHLLTFDCEFRQLS
jgi:hypothetical protein